MTTSSQPEEGQQTIFLEPWQIPKRRRGNFKPRRQTSKLEAYEIKAEEIYEDQYTDLLDGFLQSGERRFNLEKQEGLREDIMRSAAKCGLTYRHVVIVENDHELYLARKIYFQQDRDPGPVIVCDLGTRLNACSICTKDCTIDCPQNWIMMHVQKMIAESIS